MSRKILILYGSQTGNAQELAERIYRESKRLHFQSTISAFDDFDIRSLIHEQFGIFVCSTTGQGEEPDNMKKSWKFLLRKSLPNDSLNTLRFGVLGLGDSSYAKFNFPAKKLHKRLVQLGAFPIQNLGLGDDQHDLGPDHVIDPWLVTFWQRALEMYPLPSGLEPIPPTVLPQPRFRVSMIESNGFADDMTPISDHENNAPFLAVLTNNERQTSEDHFQDTRLFEFDITGSGMSYEPGNICSVQPNNLPENVDFFFELFPHLDRKKRIQLSVGDDSSAKMPPQHILGRNPTILDCVEKLWDLQSIPKRYFFELLSHFTSDEIEREKLIEFNTPEGQQDLFDYCNRPRRNILEVLWDFRHTTPNIPFEYLFDLFPMIRPRPFSIASSFKAIPNRIQVLVAIVKYRSTLAKPRLGLCSNFLKNCELGTKIPIWIQKGTFRFPSDEESNPMVMVGPGTGVAPFRSYVSEKFAKKSEECPEMALFFGCRGQKKDFYFESEWSSLMSENPGKFHLFPAFSRDHPDNKIYVQHLILKQEFLLRKLIWEMKGSFFIAGNSKQMPDQVTDALKRALKETVGFTDEKVEEYFKKMILDGRFQTETWS